MDQLNHSPGEQEFNENNQTQLTHNLESQQNISDTDLGGRYDTRKFGIPILPGAWGIKVLSHVREAAHVRIHLLYLDPLKILENVPRCVECSISEGNLLPCCRCDLFYHNECLLDCFRIKDTAKDWTCPQCQWKLISDANGLDAVDTESFNNNIDDITNNEATSANNMIASISSTVGNSNVRPGSTGKASRSSLSPTRVTDDATERKRKKPVSEGSNFTTKINVGYNHQVPFTPAFFLDDSANSHPQRQDWARLMYSPYQLEKIRRRKIQEGCQDSVIKNEFELAEFIQMCAKSWKNNPGWHPFSPEFAYKILHFADYDPNKALKYMNDPNFNFSCVCDPPTRKYDNKWKPKDRRGQVPTNPYPPPVTLRGYLLRRHSMATGK